MPKKLKFEKFYYWGYGKRSIGSLNFFYASSGEKVYCFDVTDEKTVAEICHNVSPSYKLNQFKFIEIPKKEIPANVIEAFEKVGQQAKIFKLKKFKP